MDRTERTTVETGRSHWTVGSGWLWPWLSPDTRTAESLEDEARQDEARMEASDRADWRAYLKGLTGR